MKTVINANLFIIFLSILLIIPVYAINWDPNIYLLHSFDYIYTHEHTYINQYPREFQIDSHLTFIHPTQLQSSTTKYNIITTQIDLGIVFSQSISLSFTLPIIYDDSMKDIFKNLEFSEIGITNPWLKGKFLFSLGNYLKGGIRGGLRLPIGTERYEVKPISTDLCYLTQFGYEIPLNTQVQIGYRYEGTNKNIRAPSFAYLIIKEIIPIGQRVEPSVGFGITFPLNKYHDGFYVYEANRYIWFESGVNYILTKTIKINGLINYGVAKNTKNTDKILVLSIGLLCDLPY